MKTFVTNGVVALVALLATFAIGEGAVRLLYKEHSVLFPRYHTDYQYGRYALRGIRPNSQFWHTSADGAWKFVTNAKGLRDTRDFPYAKPAGTLRVLVLGDSHTQGYEVRQGATYGAVLERYLAAKGVQAEVLNAGVSGFSTAEELAYLENEGYRYQPDVLVVGFYANDFEDNRKAGLFGLDAEGRLTELKYEHLPGVKLQNAIYALAPVRWLSENSYFYSLLFNSVWEYFKARLAKSVAVEYAVAKHDGPSEHEVRLAAALFERMQRFCASRGIRLIVADIPRVTGPYRHAPSWPADARERMAAGLQYVSSAQALSAFDGAAELHVPHGHRHISELAHALLAIELGRQIAGDAPRPARSPAWPH